MKNMTYPKFEENEGSRNIEGISVQENVFMGYPIHRHDFYEFEYILEGNIEYAVNGSIRRLSAGYASFMTPVDLHSYKSLDGKPIKAITVHFTNMNLPKDISLIEESVCIFKCSESIKQTFVDLCNEFYSQEEILKYKSLKNLLERLIILFLRQKKFVCRGAFPEDITYALSHIRRNFLSELTLEDISKKCGYSMSYFCRRFKEYVGTGFLEYLNNIRLDYALNVLRCQDISVTDLSYECGFESVRNFRRAFLKKYGCSPSEYKNSLIR